MLFGYFGASRKICIPLPHVIRALITDIAASPLNFCQPFVLFGYFGLSAKNIHAPSPTVEDMFFLNEWYWGFIEHFGKFTGKSKPGNKVFTGNPGWNLS